MLCGGKNRGLDPHEMVRSDLTWESFPVEAEEFSRLEAGETEHLRPKRERLPRQGQPVVSGPCPQLVRGLGLYAQTSAHSEHLLTVATSYFSLLSCGYFRPHAFQT